MRATRGRPRRSRRPPHHGVYARIGLSRIHGVGVRAIRDIPRGVDVFLGDSDEVVWVRRDMVRRLPPALRSLYTDFAMFWGKRLGVPKTLNMLSVGWYLNHSPKPNVEADDDGRFFSLRRIRKGEELTADYRTFSDDRLTFRVRRERADKPAARRARRARSTNGRQRA